MQFKVHEDVILQQKFRPEAGGAKYLYRKALFRAK
jgi:hypothetical protein